MRKETRFRTVRLTPSTSLRWLSGRRFAFLLLVPAPLLLLRPVGPFEAIFTAGLAIIIASIFIAYIVLPRYWLHRQFARFDRLINNVKVGSSGRIRSIEDAHGNEYRRGEIEVIVLNQAKKHGFDKLGMWSDYFYAEVMLKDGSRLIISSLLHPHLDEVRDPLMAVRERLFPSVIGRCS